MCKVKIWHCHPSRTLKWTKIGHLVTKWATPGHKKKPDQWKVWFGLFALFWPGEEKHRLIVMILTWLFSTCMSSLPPIHLPEADKHHPDTLRGGAQAEEVGQQRGQQAHGQGVSWFGLNVSDLIGIYWEDSKYMGYH